MKTGSWEIFNYVSFELDFERNDRHVLASEKYCGWKMVQIKTDRKCKIKHQNPSESRENFFFKYFS